MDTSIKAYNLFWELYYNNTNFKIIIDINLANKKIRFFNEEEWDKIKEQNFISPDPNIKDFQDIFLLGYNIGNCGGTSRQLSYSYDDVDRVTGTLPMLKGTLNAEKQGGHQWLETKDKIIDTSLMLVIDKSLKDKLGYIEEERLTAEQLKHMTNYQEKKEFTLDQSLKKHYKNSNFFCYFYII